MLSFTAFVPHPPIILPPIGGPDSAYCTKTIEAMKGLASDIEDKDIDTVVFVSPHTTLSPNFIVISNNDEASGDFGHLGHPEISYRSRIDFDLGREILRQCQNDKIQAQPLYQTGDFHLDHGVLVPYYFLKPELPSSSELVVVGYSHRSRDEHFNFGKALAKVAGSSNKNIALIASGDLSHKNLEAGAEQIGGKFDRSIVNHLTNKEWEEIRKIDEGLRDEAGECGYRSLLILLGAIAGCEVEPEILSYEAPFGVGYLVANLHIG